MTEPETTPFETGSKPTSYSGLSRRGFLGGVAVTGAALAASAGVAGAQEDGATEPEVVAEFEPPALPENLAVDTDGNVYVGMAPTGEIRRLSPDGSQSTVAQLDVGENGFLLGIVADDSTLYAALASGNPDTHGVWRVTTEGETEQVASLPADETTPNGIIHDPNQSGALLVTDHSGGAVWRVTSDGAAERWVSGPLFEVNPYASNPVGADGLAVHPNCDVFVGNLSYGGIVRVPVESDGSAGTPEVYVQDDALVGADGMTFDREGSLYVAVNAQNKVSRITPNQEIETVVSGGDLDFPSDVRFGRTEQEATSLYICNFALPSFMSDEATANPSLMKVDVGARGCFPE